MNQIIEDFFASYARALLERDAEAIADMYAVPALIAFPGQSISVNDRSQTRDFFASNWSGYPQVAEADPEVTVVAQTGHSVWVDVTWSYGGQPRERYIYQLLECAGAWQVGVLTPLEL